MTISQVVALWSSVANGLFEAVFWMGLVADLNVLLSSLAFGLAFAVQKAESVVSAAGCRSSRSAAHQPIGPRVFLSLPFLLGPSRA